MLFLNLPLAFERLMAFPATSRRRGYYRLSLSITTLRIRNCGPPNSILALKLASRPLDAAAP